MERGELGVDKKRVIVFVFEDLIADLKHTRVEKAALVAHKWDLALDQWVFRLELRNYLQRLINHMDVPVDVLTWRPIGFARALHERLWYHEMFVDTTKSVTYSAISQELATDDNVATVYDADPAHRYGYGFKCREFNLGTY